MISNVRPNVDRLKHAEPILSKMVADKTLMVVGGVYDLAMGKVNLV